MQNCQRGKRKYQGREDILTENSGGSRVMTAVLMTAIIVGGIVAICYIGCKYGGADGRKK